VVRVLDSDDVRRLRYGRTADDELTVADLTGLGIQDAAVTALAARLAGEHGAGRDVPLGDW